MIKRGCSRLVQGSDGRFSLETVERQRVQIHGVTVELAQGWREITLGAIVSRSGLCEARKLDGELCGYKARASSLPFCGVHWKGKG